MGLFGGVAFFLAFWQTNHAFGDALPMNLRMGTDTNQDDWHDLYREWGDRFLLFSRQQTRSLADAEDILQEAMIQLWNKREVLPQLEAGLVFTLIRRLAIDLGRREDRRVFREKRYASEQDPPFFQPDPSGRTAELERAIRHLPPAQQEVLVLKIWGDQTFESIAQALDISPNTAASRYRYGLENLRRELKGEKCR